MSRLAGHASRARDFWFQGFMVSGFIQIRIGIAIAFGIDCFTTRHFLGFQGFKVSGFMHGSVFLTEGTKGMKVFAAWFHSALPDTCRNITVL